MQSRHYLAKGK
jgi:hypothetical protein